MSVAGMALPAGVGRGPLSARFGLAVVVIPALLSWPAAADPVLRWAPTDTAITAGDQTTLSVMLNDTLTVRTIELYVAFDPEIIATIAGGHGALFEGFTNFHGFSETEPGLWHGYCSILGAGVWTTGPGVLWQVTVEGLQAGVSPLTSVGLVLLPPGSDEYSEAVLLDSQISVGVASPAPPDASGALHLSLHPNPFNLRTTIRFVLPQAGEVSLSVHDPRGRLMQMLSKRSWEAGRHQIEWNGLDTHGNAAASGVYLVRLATADGTVKTAKIALGK